MLRRRDSGSLDGNRPAIYAPLHGAVYRHAYARRYTNHFCRKQHQLVRSDRKVTYIFIRFLTGIEPCLNPNRTKTSLFASFLEGFGPFIVIGDQPQRHYQVARGGVRGAWALGTYRWAAHGGAAPVLALCVKI